MSMIQQKAQDYSFQVLFTPLQYYEHHEPALFSQLHLINVLYRKILWVKKLPNGKNEKTDFCTQRQ